MSTFENMIDTAALEDSGPYKSLQSTNLTPAGVDLPTYRRSDFGQVAAGVSPHGGIDYIDQSVGGVTQARGDAAAGPLRGIRSARQRFQPFNGTFIGKATVVTTRVQGRVGLSNRASVGVRATSAGLTNLPDQGAVVASFLNPALARVLSRVKGA